MPGPARTPLAAAGAAAGLTPSGRTSRSVLAKFSPCLSRLAGLLGQPLPPGSIPAAQCSVTIGGTAYKVSSATTSTWAQPGGHGTNGAGGAGGVPNPSPAAAVSNTGGAGAAGVGASDHGGGAGSSAGQAATGNAGSGLTGGAAPDSSSGAGGAGGNNAVGVAPTAGNSLYDGGGSNAPNPGGGGGGGGRTTASHAGAAGAVGGVAITYTPAHPGNALTPWSSPAGIRAVYLRTGLAMASLIPSVTAAAPPAITTTSLPAGITGQPYSATLAATGGTGPYTWSISSGSLPSGLTLNSSTGVISGTPTGGPGPVYFTVKVTDSLSSTATQPLSITITASALSHPIQAHYLRLPIAGIVTGVTSVNGAGFGNGNGSRGAPVRNPNAGPQFTQKTYPVQAQDPLQTAYPGFHAARGRIASNPGIPVPPPAAKPLLLVQHGPVRAKLLPPPPRGRMAADWGVILFQNPQAGPVFTQRTTPVRAHPVLPPRGRIASSPGKLVVVPRPPKIYPLQGPVRARIAPPFSKGRTYSHPGAPLRNPGTGPVFRQVTTPARARIIQPARGQVRSNPGAPVVLPPPAAVLFRPNGALQGKFIPHRRGMCRTILFIPVQLNPQQGPAFRQAATSVRIRPSLPPRGRTGSNPGGPVRNPVPPIIAIFRQAVIPARIRPVLPPRGRTYSHPGAPLRNPQKGPVFRQATQPARIRPQNAPERADRV